MKETKKKKSTAELPYKQSKSVKSAYNRLSAVKDYLPVYSDSYENQLKSIYQKIKETPDFSYSPENDLAYRRFADEYRRLGALAFAQNQADAQGLTGGYGSSYAPDVFSQGLSSFNESAENAKPIFYQNAMGAYAANNDLYKSIYDSLAGARRKELDEYEAMAQAENDRLKAVQKEYKNERDTDYDIYASDRDFWAKQYQYETNSDNAAKELELKKQKAAASASRSGSRSSRSSSKSDDSGKYDLFEHWSPNQRIIKFVNLNNRANSYATALEWLDYLINQGRLDKNEKFMYAYYFQKQLKK